MEINSRRAPHFRPGGRLTRRRGGKPSIIPAGIGHRLVGRVASGSGGGSHGPGTVAGDPAAHADRSQARRLAKSYRPAAAGRGLEEVGIYFIKGRVTSRSRTVRPSGGLFSTASDMFRFYQMVLDGGVRKGRRRLSEAAVTQMTRTQTRDFTTGFVEGMSFGLGWGVVKEPQGITEGLSAATFGHGGAYGTQGWVDPEMRLILVLMIQRAKLPNADGSEIQRDFQKAALEALP